MRSSKPPPTARGTASTLAARSTRLGLDARYEQARPASAPFAPSAVYEFRDIASAERALITGDYAYARHGRPNERTFADAVAGLEGAEAGLACATGMAALLVSALAVTRPGERILCQSDLYGGTRALLERELRDFGRAVDLVDVYEPAKVADALTLGAKLVLVESLSNPLLREVDVNALAWHCRAAGALLCVDNTLATPVFRRPLGAGADMVVHSGTKFLAGHHDVCVGVVVGRGSLVQAAAELATRLGATAAAFDAWLCTRGLCTLAVRMERADATARQLVERLRLHPAVRRVHFPGFGALFTLDVETRERADRLVDRCPALPIAPSFGGTANSMSHPATSSHRGLTPEERARLGIGEGLLRVSVGLEDVEDLWADLAHGLGR